MIKPALPPLYNTLETDRRGAAEALVEAALHLMLASGTYPEIMKEAAALDPNNPAHHHSMSLPGAYYMDGKAKPPQELSPAAAARFQAAHEKFQRQKAAGTLPKLFPRP